MAKRLTTHRGRASSKTRYESLDNKEYLVAPVIAVREGVLNGELLLAEEIEKYVEAWNGIPLPIGHPTERGIPVSANRPDLIESVSVGHFFNAYFEDGALKGEVWVDVEKASNLEGDALVALEMLENNESLEVSTAYFNDLEPKQGKFKGKPYKGIQRNLRPDHLALLPNDVGACSWEDGCGAPRVNKKRGTRKGMFSKFKDLLKKKTTTNRTSKKNSQTKCNKKKGIRLNKRRVVNRIMRKNQLEEDKREMIEDIVDAVEVVLPEEVAEITEETVTEVIENVVGEVSDTVEDAIMEQAEDVAEDFVESVVEEVISDALEGIFDEERDTAVNKKRGGRMRKNKKKFRINKRRIVSRILRKNEIEQSQEELVEEIADAVEDILEEKIADVTEETVADVIEDVVGEVSDTMDEELMEQAEDVASDLVEQVVEEMVEDVVEQIIEEEDIAENEEDDEEDEEERPAANRNRKKRCGGKATANRSGRKQTLDDWIGAIPDRELREFITNSRRQQQEHRTKIIKGLAANKRCAFSLSELQRMKTNQLEKLASSMEINDYSGMGMPRVNQGYYSTNSNDEIPAPPAVVTAINKKGGN